MSDLFDEALPREAPRHVGAVAPLTVDVADEPSEYLELHWVRGGTTAAIVAAVALVLRFPVWAVGCPAAVCGLLALWPVPRWGMRAWAVALASFFFAQVTTVFATPFTWPMRFGFCAALLAPLVFARL